MDSGANNSGPDDTDNGRCERDWGFETQHRHSLTRASDLSASGAELGDVGNTLTMDVDDHHRDSQMAGGRALSFSHYTTGGIPVSGDPAFRPFLEPPRPHAAAPRRRRGVLEWEFSLTISGNSQISARNRGSGKIVWPRSNLRGWTLPDANALYRGKSVKRLLRHRSDCCGWRKSSARAAGRRASSAGRGSPYPAALGGGPLRSLLEREDCRRSCRKAPSIPDS